MDLAQQLVTYNIGDGIDIALGGGKSFLSADIGGVRLDGKNLPADWAAKGANHVSVDTVNFAS